jgi:hypothetical protein
MCNYAMKRCIPNDKQVRRRRYEVRPAWYVTLLRPVVILWSFVIAWPLIWYLLDRLAPLLVAFAVLLFGYWLGFTIVSRWK